MICLAKKTKKTKTVSPMSATLPFSSHVIYAAAGALKTNYFSPGVRFDCPRGQYERRAHVQCGRY